MNQLRLTARSSRNTAMGHLATTATPAVFASFIGINAATALGWAHASGSNWMAYTASRDTDSVRHAPTMD